MLKTSIVVAVVCGWACGPVCAQESVRIDFRRDVQPLFKAYCMDCHGPK